MNRLLKFIESRQPVSEMMIVHSEIPEQADRLKSAASRYLDPGRIIVSQLGAALGVHGGPGVLLVAVR